MSSKDKDKTLQDKLKQFFRLNKGNAGTVVERLDFSLSPDIELAIGPHSMNVNERVKNLKDISNVVLQKNLEEHAVEKLWSLVQDLLREDVSKEHRHIVFQFLCNLAQGQADKLGIIRGHFFRLIQTHPLREDVGPRLDLLRALTDNGKDVLYMETEVAPFLLSWMAEVSHANKTNDLLSLLVNVVKYNAGFVEDEIISGLIQNACFLCSWSQHEEVVFSSLALLDVIVCYSQISPNMLETFVFTLCNLVNNKTYSQSCWKIMKKVLGTHVGHSALFQMISLLKDRKFSNNSMMLRGAIFYVSMGMWGGQKVTSLNTTACTVLPAYMEAIKHGHTVVTYEVLICLHKLIVHSPSDLSDPAWNNVLGILEIAMILVQRMNPPVSHVINVAHDLLTDIEALHERGDFRGDVARFYNIIASCAATRPEISILHLITYLAADFTPTKHKWLTKLNDFIERYFWQETRSNIRVKVLDVISSVVHANRALYEEELLEKVLNQLEPAVARDPDLVVRNASVQLLVELCLECENKRCLELLDLIDEFLHRPFEIYEATSAVIVNEADVLDVKSAALGMIKIFHSKAYQLPSTHAIRAYKALVTHLENHYKKPAVFESCNAIRFLIFKCFLQIRADSLYHLGMPDPLILDNDTPCSAKRVTRFSPYLAVDHRLGEKPSASVAAGSASGSAFPAPTVTYLSLTHACSAVIICLNSEKDWRVLTLILSELPQVMQNKSLILSKHGNDVEYLASALYTMVTDLTIGDKLKTLPPKMSRSDAQSLVLLSMASLVSYPLDSSMQQKIVKCLQLGLTTTIKCAIDCMSALTLCTLDMQETMYKLLPEVLLKLSKISTTVHMAIPMLEFLSTLTRLPKVFASFVYDQYLSVFAIALPYTNPFKFSHFVVSLAHHVIAVWFFKSRMPFRSKLVGYIIKGLKNNLTGETIGSRPDMVNEDSSNRRRSSSLTEQGSRHHKEQLRQRVETKPAIDETMMLFHTELTETCIDMMSRYTFSRCSALPKRPPTTQWLFNDGQSMTWLLGHKLITVTTSNCSQKAIKSGLCDKCLHSCRLDKTSGQSAAMSAPQTQPPTAATSPMVEKAPSPPVDTDLTPSRRRHKSAIQGSVSRDSVGIFGPRTKDDLHMNSRAPDAENSRNEGFLMMQVEKSVDFDRGMCTCWCQSWAEINIGSPTGHVSWTMRLQNLPYFDASAPTVEFPLADVSTFFFPELESREGSKSRISSPEIQNEPIFSESIPASPVGQTQHTETAEKKPQSILPSPSQEVAPIRPTSEAVPVPGAEPEDSDEAHDEEEGLEGDSRRRNRVKRSNSSPEMSSRLRSPLSLQPPALHAANSLGGDDLDKNAPLSPTGDEKKLMPKPPPTRVSCEAIPEEMGGTSPPSTYPAEPVLKVVQAAQVIEAKPIEQVLPPQPQIMPQPTPQPVVKPALAPMKSAPMVPEKRTEKSPPQDARPDPSTLPPLSFRDRGHTISVMSPVKRPDPNLLRRNAAGGSTPRGAEPVMNSAAMKPSFVFLQLYQTAGLGSKGEKPVLVPKDDVVNRTVKTLSYIPPYETHKLGVLYVGPNQANNETEILRNTCGSVRYTEFLSGLGTLIKLKAVDSQTTFLGGLDQSGNDGKFAYIWHDAMTQVIFHVATLMPTKETDPSCNNKKLHIGNDFVTIVFNESGQDYNVHCITGQFNFACVVVTPMGHGTNQVTMKIKEDLTEHLGASQVTRIISDQSLPTLVRQLALHANLASLIVRNMSKSVLYASNWLERLRNIKRIRARVLEKAEEKKKAADMQNKDQDDFTEFAVYSDQPDAKNQSIKL